MKKHLAVIALLVLTACTTTTKDSGPGRPTVPAPPSEIDMEAVKFELGLGRSIEELGFAQKSFDSCRIEPTPLNCGRKNFVLIHFRLQCRDSVGTVDSVSHIELMPVITHNLRWKLGSVSGVTHTDSDGYGQIQLLTSQNAKKQRLIFQIGNNTLGITAEELSRLIVPRDWCE